jgi:hypothetical protein
MRAMSIKPLLVALPFVLSLAACGKSKEDAQMECADVCLKMHDDAEKKCGKDDAACWAPLMAEIDNCQKACDAAAKK